MREFSYMRFVFALFDFMRAHCIGCIGEEGFLNDMICQWLTEKSPLCFNALLD